MAPLPQNIKAPMFSGYLSFAGHERREHSIVRVVKWQTREVESFVPETAYGFDSHHEH